MAGAVFGAWRVGPEDHSSPVRWLKIAGYSVGTLLFVAWGSLFVVAGLFRLDKGPAGHADRAGLLRWVILLIPLAVFLYIVRLFNL